MFWFEAVDLKFNSDETIEAAVKKQEIESEVAVTNLEWVFGADEAEILTHFIDEIFEAVQQAVMKVCFRMTVW